MKALEMFLAILVQTVCTKSFTMQSSVQQVKDVPVSSSVRANGGLQQKVIVIYIVVFTFQNLHYCSKVWNHLLY